MKNIKKYKLAVIVLVSLIIMLLGVLFWNKVIVYQKTNKELTPISEPIDVSDANNIPSVESKLGQPMRISQSYLLRYTTNKSSVWYMSSAKIKSISYNTDEAIVTLVNDDETKILVATISKDKINVKKDDIVNFVGTINLANGGINLSKISKDTINYKDATKINYDDLTNNIKSVLNNQFVISGYMVTDGNKFKLFESKNSYNKSDKVGTYFTLNWKDTFNFTGNANVTVKCYIGDTYKLKDCEILS